VVTTVADSTIDPVCCQDRLHLLPSASQSRIGRARAWLEARQPAEEILILGANLDAANELARDVARSKGAAFGWHRLSLSQFAALLAAPELASRRLVSVPPLGVRAICARVVHKLAADSALGRFASIASGPGFVPALASVTTELRLAKLGPDALHDIAPDLMPLFRAYETMLAEGGFTDWAGLLVLATEALAKNSSTRRLTYLPTLLLDVPASSDAELDFVKALRSQAPECLITAPAADERTLSRFERLRLNIENLDLAACSEAATAKTGSLARLQRHLFKESFEPSPPVSDKQVVIFSAPGEGRECVEIARKVLSLARGGLPFDRMAVLLRSPEQYRAPLEEAFGRARIPAHFARGAVTPDPTGRAFCVLLRCAAEGLFARRFAEYLSLGQVPDAKPDGAPPEAAPRSEYWVTPDQELITPLVVEGPEEQSAAAPSNVISESNRPVTAGQLRAPRRWERLLVEAAVIGGQERWRKRIQGLANELRLQIAELEEEDEGRAASTRRTLEDLEALADFALPLIELLSHLPRSASWGEWLDQLGALATRALRKPDRVLSVLSELAPMSEVGPVELDEVLLTLSDLLLEVAVPPPDQRYGKVFVAPVVKSRRSGIFWRGSRIGESA
jgi:hypothetical protein